ncbi:MAG: Response regulator receiver:Metal-dependent phosphohydrolase, subdomain [Proteobacteria bacterium]|nr:Response regulator receiver:Metal-dependent phosphohydrolase, subdomain [Pseudomonadota bacterium]
MNETPPPAITLLFVDDEPSILSSLRRLFRQHGYRILMAESGAAGLQLLETEHVDLVISDMRMPEMDGAKFLEQVRARWPKIVRILLTGYADIGSTINAINRGEIYRYISKPWDDNEIVLTVRDALERNRLEQENERLLALTREQNEELKNLNATLEQKVASRTEEVRQTFGMLESAHRELKRSFMATVKVFASLIELRGGKVAGHSRRVADHVRELGNRLHLDEATQQDVLIAALLHDIGKIGLSNELIERPFNSLSADARGEVMKHPIKGEQVLMGVDQLKGAALLIRHHHELFDGSGYPDHLAGLAIPLGCRILTVANEYDALQMGTLVQQPMRAADALNWLIDNRGKRYDPAVVDALAALLSEQHKDLVVELPTRPSSLKPGMILSRDLAHPDGYLLLAKGQKIDAAMIEQLRRLEAVEGRPLTAYIREESKK